MYFSKLPKTNYSYLDSNYNIQKKLAIDITSRVKVAEYVKIYKTNFNKYTIRDEERPDTLSYKLYDRPDLHWVFFIVNDMVNPYESWPKSSYELNSFVDEKYSGTSVFVPDIWFPRTDVDENYEYSVVYSELKNITDYNSGFNKKVLPRTTLVKIDESKGVKIYLNGVMYTSTIKKINSEFYEFLIETKSWEKNPSLTNAFLFYEVESFNTRITIRTPITRIIQEGRYSVNNFQVQGEYRDPSQSFEIGQSVYGEGLYGPYGHFIHPLISEQISNGIFSNIQKPSFAYYYAIRGDDGEYLNSKYYETNEEYELRLNEEKRKILVPKPSLVQDIMNSLDKITKSIGTNQ